MTFITHYFKHPEQTCVFNICFPDSSIPSDPSGLRTPSQTSSIEDKEIPFLFYNELLQNSDLQDLLAGKITQCLDSTTGK